MPRDRRDASTDGRSVSSSARRHRRRLATGIDADRAFDRMSVLADALEGAGCDDADVLSHRLGLGPHVRGCWVVDLVPGRG